MKKLLFILTIILCSSCTCLLSQIPPQTIYADQNCQGILPDYTTRIVATDNCLGAVIVSQTPVAGTLLTVSNPAVTVTLVATDAFGNKSKPLNVSVVLLDTVPPVLSWPTGQINMTEQDLINVYANWEAGIKVHGIAKWMYDRSWQQGLILADTTFVDSCGITHSYHVEDNLKYFQNVIKLSDEEYAQYVSYVEANK